MKRSEKKDREPSYALSQQDADMLLEETKRRVEKMLAMPDPGEKNKEFHVTGLDSGERFTISLYQGAKNPRKHSLGARIAKSGIPLLRLCVNGSRHTNPDGSKVGGTHWHIYKEGYDDWYAFTADLQSGKFIDDTITLLDKFHVIEKPDIQGGFE